MNTGRFPSRFKTLTGHPPFPWQERLYEILVSEEPEDWPDACDIPTGLGKTSVVAVWLLAFLDRPDKLPRRLVYVVNRRTVVDQTTDEVMRLREKLPELCGEDMKLGISTLRGQFADNREWSANPFRLAVVSGTVDMIGSRLLFSGYGCGFRTRPLHAGFLGQDVLLVHDEAHLEPAFQRVIEEIETEQRNGEQTNGQPWPKLRAISLSATRREGGEKEGEMKPILFELNDEDKEHPVVKDRIFAKKALHLHENKEKAKLAEEIADLALKHKDSGKAVLVFVHKVEDVDKVTKRLPKGSFEKLTGTLRGLERDDLVNTKVFQRFLPPSSRDETIDPESGTVFLVCTSAGEVGVNISADHLACDLTTFESMAQRLGRVNRFGDCDDTRIDVVSPQDGDFDSKREIDVRRRRTLILLQQLEGNGSPAALGDLCPKDRSNAFAPQPEMLPTSDILFDAWALTTIRGKMPGRPPVDPYLHGIRDWEPPETHVAWRQEVELLTGDLLTTYSPEDLLEDYPLKPHELLRDRTDRVFKELKTLATRHGDHVQLIWLVQKDGSVQPTTLKKVVGNGKKEMSDHLAGLTVLLSPSAGGLNGGMLDGSAEPSKVKDEEDVADEWFVDNDKTERHRKRVWDDDDPGGKMRCIRTIDVFQHPDEEADEEPNAQRYWRMYERRLSGDTEGSKTAERPVSGSVHLGDVERQAIEIVEPLALPRDLKTALVSAARWHDLGKNRGVWQRSIGNRTADKNNWWAKSGKRGRPLDICPHYRHEFGSLLDVLDKEEFSDLDEHQRDLVLHFIATHHGYARPHFPPERAFDPDRSDADAAEVAMEIPRRFARLQRRYGRWGLAYLESLLRAADYAASAAPSKFVEDDQ